MTAASMFDLDCRACPRLSEFLDDVKSKYPDYHCRPVPPFGDPEARLLIVGLAPGMHGANRSGRPFTGDHAGILLYQTLFDCGFSTGPESIHAGDGLRLLNCRISNAVKCLPPQNKPTGDEIRRCNHFIAAELDTMPEGSVAIALGKIAHDAILRALGFRQSAAKFAHAAEHDLGRIHLIDSYHCSRYNTQTRRLTPEMFQAVFRKARLALDSNA